MIFEKQELEGLFIIKPEIFEDDRGYFFESYREDLINNILSYEINFIQENVSKSSKGVLRGLHYQTKHPQGKLVRCTQGSVYDVIVDLRKSSPTFGESYGVELSENNKMLWVPIGFAHSFYTLSDYAEFEYKCTDYYYPESMETLMWNDPDLNIEWPFEGDPILSAKDLIGKSFKDCFKYEYE